MPPSPAALRTLLSWNRDSLGGALSQGSHRAPAHALSGQHQHQHQGCHALLPLQGHRSVGAPAWVALGLARPGRDAGTWAGTLPLGAPGFFLQAPQPRAELGPLPLCPQTLGVAAASVYTRAPASPLGTPQQVPQPPIPTGTSGFLLPLLPCSPRHWPSPGSPARPRARHRGVTCLSLGCREIAGATGPHGNVHPEANLGPAFPACSALCQALGPPGPLQTPPCSQGSWVPCGPWASRGRAAAQSGSARLGWGGS